MYMYINFILLTMYMYMHECTCTCILLTMYVLYMYEWLGTDFSRVSFCVCRFVDSVGIGSGQMRMGGVHTVDW